MKIVRNDRKTRLKTKYDTSLLVNEEIEVYAIVTFLKKKHYLIFMNNDVNYIDGNEVSVIDSTIPSDWIYREFRKPYKIERAYDMYGSDVMKIEQYLGPKEFLDDPYFLFNVLFYPNETVEFFHRFQKEWYKNQEQNERRYMKVFIEDLALFKKINHVKNLQVVNRELEVYAVVDLGKHKYYLLNTEDGLKYIRRDSVKLVNDFIPENWIYKHFGIPYVIKKTYSRFRSKYITLKQYLGPKEFLENEQFLFDVMFFQNKANDYFYQLKKDFSNKAIKTDVIKSYNQRLIQYLDWNYPEDIQKEYIKEVSKIKDLSLLMQPNNKNVWESCASILVKKSDKELTPYLLQLFEWTQDLNWPGAYIILERLQNFDSKTIKDVFELIVSRAIEEKNDLWLNNLSLLFKNASFKVMIDKKYTKYLND